MLTLMFWACLAASCHQVQMDVSMTKNQCTLFGQMAILEWLDNHPKYTWDAGKGYQCVPAGKDA